MNSIFRVRFAWYLVAPILSPLLFAAIPVLPASAALLVGLRHPCAQFLASDLYKS